jgi:hypothetical protein
MAERMVYPTTFATDIKYKPANLGMRKKTVIKRRAIFPQTNLVCHHAWS